MPKYTVQNIILDMTKKQKLGTSPKFISNHLTPLIAHEYERVYHIETWGPPVPQNNPTIIFTG